MIKAYKGFNKDMTCRDFQFEEGKEYVYDGEVKVCESGFHACERPLDCFDYYYPAESVYHEVELSDDISKSSDDTKVAAKKIKIGARLDIAGLVNAQFEYVKDHTTSDCTDLKAASAGYKGAASAGSWGAASAGYKGAASAGYKGAASAGSRGAASAGENGTASAGSWGAASAGENGAAVSRGTSEVGKNGIACARGNNCKVKGGMGAVLAIVDENGDDYDIKSWKVFTIDGKKYKPDTWYCLKDGEPVEAEE